MNCLNCTNLTTKPRSPDPVATKAAREMAAQGFGTCLRGPLWVFKSPRFERKCGMFDQVPEEQMAARRKWAESQ